MAYNVSRRTNEIGIRIVLGTEPGEVLRMMLRQALFMIADGIAIGVPLAAGSVRLIANELSGVKPADPLTIALAALIMAAVGLIAGFAPAHRAARVDPTATLRHERFLSCPVFVPKLKREQRPQRFTMIRLTFAVLP